ncbi:pyruvate,water dikinase [Dyadobacter sp. BE34]|uniref:Pyruvate,water dikinase n=1 Tax=Dyadobacter fermentans TaxID=94254 RepID=A0ABU1QZY6_9BACT|nr:MULTISPECIES: rifamycin-inactivating phosphotransferase [Dyadobacter]MDR6806718.1 pyruvate,water dikinase [Dyadobacter fermentans]MDR7044460.1 pyruvate,water dikinase [Dyadobacter sp. BE242]MDR7198770.1 pyruvate,water dikinase [Dyadobacter sp. BE34]MDR7216732.1 pyruvate,water dikinase [Dyadobacter sp. BE31]MDR7263742.1 pyruvate,water dikinase [Dyadobacter sp. BE32]
MGTYTLDFQEIGSAHIAVAGGKGANLGELARIDGIVVPGGFCITTEAFREVTGGAEIGGLLEKLASVTAADSNEIAALARAIRGAIEAAMIPEIVREEIVRHVAKFGEGDAYAVRSSATAEDLPNASFAGQQDTYLNIVGSDAILQHVSKCWASLFTDRAIAYRIQNGFDHRKVSLAVVVQRMVFPQASGVMFTADPVNSNRKVVSIDASFGLGEALVSGLVNADIYKVRGGEIIEKKVAAKKMAIYASEAGGTREQELGRTQQELQTLTDEQILQLERLGRRIEAHFGSPQDIEWCLADGAFYIVQSRPITTLYPVPETNDGQNHLYVSVGHQQMMTDAMKPLGLSVWQLTSPRKMAVAGGRIFVDVAQDLVSPMGRKVVLDVLGKSDPLVRKAVMEILERGDFLDINMDEPSAGQPAQGPPPHDFFALHTYDPSIVQELIGRSEASIATLAEDIRTRSGVDLIDFIRDDFQQRKSQADPQSFGVIVTAMNAALWLNEKMNEWLGEKNVADALSQSVPHNVTSEMGLALLDVADAIRPYPEVVGYLRDAGDDFMDRMQALPGGAEAVGAINAFLSRYGMRCAGEIDITRTRWSENPAILIPLILSNIRNQEPGAGKVKFEQGKADAARKEAELLNRLRQLPDGEQKAEETQRMIGLMRSLAGYREYPKYAIVSRYFVYKKALMEEADRLVNAQVLREREDIYYLEFEEIRGVILSQKADYQVIDQRKEAYGRFEKLRPPRVMTSDGEVVTGKHSHENLPEGAIAGLGVSAGVIEGRARVVLKMEDANLEPGDILVTAFTDPSWTPLFVAIKGLVTEVGGLMTHGAVIAREYGLPAVVGVDHATRLITDGRKIRVHGTDGYIELL